MSQCVGGKGVGCARRLSGWEKASGRTELLYTDNDFHVVDEEWGGGGRKIGLPMPLY